MKSQKIYICTKCDSQFSKWSGRCLECGAWASIVEQNQQTQQSNNIKIIDLNHKIQDKQPRFKININEINRVLGNGLVKASFILLGGEPGIGKSTLVLQLANSIKNTLYISAEESAEQVLLRAKRLKINNPNIKILANNNLETIINTAKKNKPDLLIIDSIQTIFTEQAENLAGSITQIKACTAKLLDLCKNHNITILIIGHITKDGIVAGPKTLEHMVDTVLYLEGDKDKYFRILRTVKNRFGSTNEIGVFEMTETGLKEIPNPSELFLQGIDQNIPGSIVTVINQGQRCFLIEIQSLVNKTNFGLPQRKTSGYDNNRLQMLIAVLCKRLNLPLNQYDVFLNIIGGLKIKDVTIDLAICMSLISAYKNKILDKNVVAIGEVGLGGEIRPIPLLKQKIIEASRLGYKKIYIPKTKNLDKIIGSIKPKTQCIQVENLKNLIRTK